jgi:predicted CXXCH cytochrome family protein
VALAAAALGLVATASIALADAGPHGGFTVSTDGCASCHRTHTAQGTRLLNAAGTIQALCLSCHGGTSASMNPQYGYELNSGVKEALRGGGFTEARIKTSDTTHPGEAMASGDTGQTVNSAHMKGGGLNGLTPKNIIWGNTSSGAAAYGKDIASSPLTCSDCHDPHGNGHYRILRSIPKGSGLTSGGQDLPDQSTKEYTTTNYWTQYSSANMADEPWTAAEMSNWCSTCHTLYNSSSSSDASESSIFKYRHKTNGVALPARATAPYPSDSFPVQCLQCHVSHGSNANFIGSGGRTPSSARIPWPDDPLASSGGRTSSATRTTDRTSQYESTLLKIDNRGTCVACHGTDSTQFP